MTFLQTYSDKQMDKIRIVQQLLDRKVTIKQVMERLSCSNRTVYRYKRILEFE